MKIGKKKRKNADIGDSGAMSDLAFLLIVFFIVIAVFNINKGFILGLPKKSSTKIVNVKDIIKVTLKEDGTLIHENKSILKDDIKTIVRDKLLARPNMTFLLKIEAETPYQEVVNMVDMVKELEVENFSFSMIGGK